MLAKDVESYRDLMRRVVMPFFEGQAQSVLLGCGGVSLRTLHIAHDPARRGPHSCTLIFVPGRTESFFKYAETFYDLWHQGHEIFALDHRGQGFSERLLANPQVGYVQDFADYERDLVSFLTTAVVPKKAFSRTFLVAHSMGAALSLRMLLGAQQGRLRRELAPFLEGFCGVVLSAPMLAIRLGFAHWLTEIVVGLRCVLGKDKDYAASPGAFDPVSYGEDLTHSVPRLTWYRAALAARPELQLGMPSNQWMLEALRFCSRLRADLERTPLACPVLLLSPGRDTVVETKAQNVISQSYQGRLLERIHLPQSAHDPFLEADEIREVVLRSIEQFIGIAEEVEHKNEADSPANAEVPLTDRAAMLARAVQQPIAHRGLFIAHERPENSLAAFAAAVDGGFGMECDVHLTLDGEVIVFHDDTLERLTQGVGGGAVADAPWSALRDLPLQGTAERIPRLKDLLALLAQRGQRLPLIIELKSFTAAGWDRSGRLERATLEVLNGYGGDVVLKSFNPHTVQTLLDLQSPWPVGHILCQLGTDGDFAFLNPKERDAAMDLCLETAARAEFVSYGIGDLTPEIRYDARLKAKPWMSWTIRTPEQLEKAESLGCQWIFEVSVLDEVRRTAAITSRNRTGLVT